MTIDFQEIPLDLHRPGTYVEIDESLAFQGLAVFSQKIVIIAQMFTAGGHAGTANPLELQNLTRIEDADLAFGPGSMAARCFRAVKAVNAHNEVKVMGVADDDAATAAEGTVEFTAVPSRNGTLEGRIAGQRVRIAAKTTDTVTTLAAAFADAINDIEQLPVTAAAAIGVVTLTAKHEGEAGNDIDIRFGYYLDGPLPVGIGITVTPMAGGAANPDIATAIAALDELEIYDSFVIPYTDAANLLTIETELEDRFTALRAVDGVNFVAVRNTFAGSVTAVEARDSQFTLMAALGKTPTPPWEIAAAYAGVTTFAATVDPGRPFKTLELTGVLPPSEGVDRFDDTERELLLQKGAATFKITADNRVVIERAVTTYKTTGNGAEDPSFQDLNTMRLMTYYRRSVVNWWDRKFPRHKLADNNQPVNTGQSIMTPASAEAEQTAHYERLVNAGLFQDLAGYKRDLRAEKNENVNGRLDIFDRPRPIGQLQITAIRAAFRL